MAASVPARTPEELHAAIQEAMNAADVEAFLDAHEDDATVIVPPAGTSAHGREEIREAIAPLLALGPELVTAVVKKLQTDDLALTHGRWRLTVTEHGRRSDMHGHGTMVSRRRSDGTWRIVLDDPLAAP